MADPGGFFGCCGNPFCDIDINTVLTLQAQAPGKQIRMPIHIYGELHGMFLKCVAYRCTMVRARE